MHIPQVLFAVLLLLQTTDASVVELKRYRRSPNIQNIRLRNLHTTYSGRVEVQGPNGTWGTICDHSFDEKDAMVVCRMLGFVSSHPTVYHHAQFGQGSGPIWLSDLGCTGTEADLERCTSGGWGQHNCRHSEDAGVDCKFEVLNIRLAGNGSTNSRGRVEVESPNGTWGMIGSANFGVRDAVVICRMLGFNTSGVVTYSNYFGTVSGPVWINNLLCVGTETHINQCTSEGYPNGDGYGSHAGVACDVGVVIQNARLVGRRGTHEGRVEILDPDGMWGTLTSNLDENAAKVICRMLGFETEVVSVFYYSHFGEGSGSTYYIENFGCKGRETNITDCATSGLMVNFYTGHGNDIGVSCNIKENDIRLVGGNSELEGRVEVYHNGVWGTVCNNGFDNRDAEVICYMLGYDTSSVKIYTYAHYGSGVGQIWLNNLSCNGTESRLEDCPSLTWGTNSCSHSQDVGVDCHQSVRLYGGRYPSDGYVQIGNDWKTICGYYSDGNLGRVLCQSLGFDTSYWNSDIYNLYGTTTTSNTTIRCPRGTESNIAECKQGSHINCRSIFGYTLYANCTGNLNGILVGGAHNWEGNLLIRNIIDSRLFRVCTDVWTDKEATLFCQLISRNIKGNVYGRVIRNTAFNQQPGSFIFLSTHCNGGVPFCVFEVNSTESCPYTDIAMSCAHSEQDSKHSVRLADGQAEYEGRIEINFNNQWHTLCDIGWDHADAVVFCRSLGYWVSSPTAYDNAWFGPGSVQSTHVNPYCNGNEQSIFDCPAEYIWGFSSCPHSEDAGVRCTPVSLGRNNIRLAYGPGPWKGKLEVFYNNQWGGVCMKSWNQRSTDVVCRMMMYNSARPNHYVFKGTSTTILIGDLQCRGNETDIGLCKAFLDKTNCTDEIVGIDCSDGIQARLTGGNQFLGYAQLQINGIWKQICSSEWKNEEAAVFCRTLGFSLAVAATNVNLSNAVSASKYSSIECSGWEDHIGQCRMQNPPSNCSYATVNCLKCFDEYYNNTGTVVSSYQPNWSCVYIIRPRGPSKWGLYTLKFNRMYLSNPGDEVQVRDGFPGRTLYSWKGYCNIYGNQVPIIAKEFSIHVHSESSGAYQAQWAPLVLEDALTAGCTSSGWNITINSTILRMLYPDVNPGDIYMTMGSCTGKAVDDGLQFLHSYSGCNTQRKISSGEIIYTNHLVQPIYDSNFPSIVFGYKWRVETICSIPATDTNSISIHHSEGQTGSGIDNGYHNLTSTAKNTIEFQFYTDPAFRNQIKGDVYVPVGHELYVRVFFVSQDITLKMRIETCTVFDETMPSRKFTLIRDGCPTTAMVHLISTENHEMRFSYQVFEFKETSYSLAMTCNATFCGQNDNSHRCTQGCTTKRAMVSEQELASYVTYEIKSRTIILQKEAPDAILFADTMIPH